MQYENFILGIFQIITGMANEINKCVENIMVKLLLFII